MTTTPTITNAPPERRLTRQEASNFLSERGYRVAITTLSKYVVVGGGPPYEKFGRKPLYTPSGLLGWVSSKTGHPQRHSSGQ